MKRLLCILSSMNAGGAETFLMKVYRKLDKTRYQMDFCVNVQETCFYEEEILALGGKVHRIPSKSENRKEFTRQLRELIVTQKYESVLRITSNAMGFMDLMIAKQAGAKLRAVRSSNSSGNANWKSQMAHRLGRLLYGKYVNVKFAPSDLAAEYTFGKKACRAGQVTLLCNGVDLNVFHYDADGRVAVRKEFGIEEDCLLVGHVGRFMLQKNHKFLLHVFGEIVKKRTNAKLLLVGNGPLEQDLRKQAAKMGIAEQIIFAGIRKDVPQLLSAMDVFVFPSFYEGMPNTVIEAQATGLPCVIANTITKTANITGLIEYLSLDMPAGLWAERALAQNVGERAETTKLFLEQGYDIESVARQFVKLCFEQ